MARSFVINGETLVKVKGVGALASSGGNAKLWELGLTSEPITIMPRFFHQNIQADDYGPNIPANVMSMLGDCDIKLSLIHYDEQVLRNCIAQSMAYTSDGTFRSAGTLLKNNGPIFSSGNFFTSLSLVPGRSSGLPWRFPYAYLADSPLELSLGTQRSLAVCHWKALPLSTFRTTTLQASGGTRELTSDRALLWDHERDISEELVLGSIL